MRHVDEIEAVERLRFAVLAASGLLFFLASTYFGLGLVASAFYAFGMGLIASGCHFAYRITREIPWTYVLAEQRLSGGRRTKHGVWLGGIIPGVFVLCVGYWWHP